jgi:hypothetical protein
MVSKLLETKGGWSDAGIENPGENGEGLSLVKTS